MKKFSSLFSLWTALPLIFLYISACGIATFVENDYGTATAKALIYNTWWFNLLHILVLLTLIGSFILSKAWQRKKYASLLFHASIIVIILGAGVTRFLGFEGMMHIREGEKSNFILSNETYLSITAKSGDKEESIYIPADLVAGQTLSKKTTLLGKPLTISIKEIRKISLDKRDASAQMILDIAFDGHQEEIRLLGGIGIEGKPLVLKSNNEDLTFVWGVRRFILPFSIALKDFQLDRYPGSMSPSSYASEVEVIDDQDKINQPFRIFMNNVLDYKGYRFFQSSYDTDEQGTILSVNNDPGKNITYLGYALLILGSIWLLLDRNGRFMRLSAFLKEQKIASLLIFALFFNGIPSNAQEVDTKTIIENFKNHSVAFSQNLETLLVQDYGGRIKPINTLATDMIHKITKQDNFLGLSNTQLFLGMMMLPDEFQKLKMIKVSNPRLRKILGTNSNLIAFNDVFTPEKLYVLQNYVEEANVKKPSTRDTFDKDVIAVDEKINLAYMIYTGEVFRVFPDVSGSNTWYQPVQAIQSALSHNQKKEAVLLNEILETYVSGLREGIMQNQWSTAIRALQEIRDYQKQHGSDLILDDTKIKSEIFLNKTNFFKYLILPYILLGVVLFAIVLVFVFKNKTFPYTTIFYMALLVLTILITLSLALRWYVSGHAPWSNAYESMLYIAWASSMSAVLFFRKSALAISSALFLSGISLFVADLGFMDPQISNLVPVLKSYWLNIHVSIITASYGFLGLCFILGVLTLFMFILRNPKKPQIDNTLLSLTAINEMAMIFGLFMLTIGNFLGGVWANESWGRYWGWDPKETWALISIGVYAIIVHLRFLGFKNMPFVFASLATIGFFSILMTYFGVNYYLSGMHSYAAGDPLPIPTFVYFLTFSIFALIAIAFPKRKLSFPKI